MRSFFVALKIILISVFYLLTACGSTKRELPGFPLLAMEESEGPVHIQILSDFKDETVIILDYLKTDGKPTRCTELRVNRHSQILERKPISHDIQSFTKTTSPQDRYDLKALPIVLSKYKLEIRTKSKNMELWMVERGENGEEIKITSLPRSSSKQIEGIAFPSSDRGQKEIDVAVLAWRHEKKEILIRGLIILDLRSARADLYQQKGIASHLKGNHDQALSFLKTAWATNPDNPLIAYNKARILEVTGEIELSLDYLEKAVQLDQPRIRMLIAEEPFFCSARNHPRFAEIAGPSFGNPCVRE